MLLVLLSRIALGGRCGQGVTNDEDNQQKLVLMHQAFLCKFKRWLKFGIQDALWR